MTTSNRQSSYGKTHFT